MGVWDSVTSALKGALAPITWPATAAAKASQRATEGTKETLNLAGKASSDFVGGLAGGAGKALGILLIAGLAVLILIRIIDRIAAKVVPA